jgi:carbamoyltransferase
LTTSILGISAFYHDSAAALVVDGEIVAAAQEERFTREKHDERFPTRAIAYCLEQAGLQPEQLDYVGFYDKPLLTYGRLLETYLAYAPRGLSSYLRAMPLWLKQKLHLQRAMSKGLNHAYKKRFIFTEHHESHAASAFFPSPFEEAAILTLDGVGEWATASYGTGRGNRIALTHQLDFPHSLGLLYSAFTYYCGFKVNSGEYKLMGLAPYGEPRYVDKILDNLIDLKPDGSFRMDMSYFNYCQGLTMTSPKFHELFGGPPRQPEDPWREHDMDVAASIQRVTEEIMLRAARHVHAETGMRNLCLAGGVALNCVANGRILREGPFERIWIQPAAGDAGGALGVALLIWFQLLGKERVPEARDALRGALLGNQASDDEIASFLQTVDVDYDHLEDDDVLCDRVADAIAAGKVVGWYQGRMEFGPRALGSRSILGDARNPEMQSIINLKVKFREGFRPFAPIVLEEYAHEFFQMEQGQESPYMALVAPVRDSQRLAMDPAAAGAKGIDKLKQMRSTIPAVTHVDYSARVQTVDPERHGLLRKLLEKFHRKTGCPVMVNTSFNLGWDPIVCSPEDAYRTFMSSDVDVLCMGRYVVDKGAQRSSIAVSAGQSSLGVVGLRSPCCGALLRDAPERLECAACDHAFPVSDGVPQLFWPHEGIDAASDVTEVVKAFYEDAPFPNYDEHDSVRTLIEKSRKGLYARRLDETIPHNGTVLEVGCGTGQLTNFLGIGFRQVVGTDMCLNSLRLGEAFRREHGLARVRFLQMNLFRPAFEPAAFDVVLCNGVLHHTSDPRGGFESLLPLLRPGGHIVIGLYNAYGRLFTDLRRSLFRLSRGRARWIDPVLRQRSLSQEKRRAWFADQYRHPHESKHTFGEVLEWFDGAGIEFVRGVPALRLEDDGLGGASLFEPQIRGTALDHLIVQAAQVVSPAQREGGFFVMIGRKPGGDSVPGSV